MLCVLGMKDQEEVEPVECMECNISLKVPKQCFVAFEESICDTCLFTFCMLFSYILLQSIPLCSN